MSQNKDKPASKSILWIPFLTIFLDLLGFGIIIPIQPFYAESFGASPSTVTLLGASYSLMQFLFTPFWGRLSDRIGRRPIMLISIAIGGIGYLIFGLANSLIYLFAARLIAGFGNANLGTAQAIIADTTTSENRAKGMGLIGAAFGLGFIFGPALGGGLGQFGPQYPGYVAAGLAACNWIFAYLKLPETLKQGAKSHAHRRGVFSIKAIKHATRHPNVAQLFSIMFIATVSFSIMEQVFGLFIEHSWIASSGQELTAHQRLGQAAALTAYALLLVGVIGAIVQGGLIGKLTKRFGESKLARTGFLIQVLALGLMPFSAMFNSFTMFLGSCALIAVGSGITGPSVSSMLSRSVDGDEQGGVLGLGHSLSSLGRVVGPSLAGLLFEFSSGAPFWFSSVLMMIPVVMSLSIIGVGNKPTAAVAAGH